MKNKLLINILSIIFALILTFNLGVLVLDIYRNSISDPMENISSPPQPSWNYNSNDLATIYKDVGFKIPVAFQFFYIDTVVQAVGILKEGEESMSRRNDEFGTRHWFNTWQISYEKWYEQSIPDFDSLYTIDTLITKAIVDDGTFSQTARGEKLKEKYQANQFYLHPVQRDMKTVTRVSPKTKSQFWLFLVRANLIRFLYIFLIYQLLRLFLQLRSNFSFTQNLQKKVGLIGWGVIVYVGLQYLFDYLVGKEFIWISIQSVSSNINYMESIHSTYHYYYQFHFDAFGIGLLLLVLSTLMKRAASIEEEWSLTI